MKENYTLDYLSCGSPIFQVKGLYTFTSDSIALAHFVKEKKIETLVDLCAGSGVVGLETIETREVKNLIMVEFQKELSEASKESGLLTKTKTNIIALNMDVKKLGEKIKEKSVDVITVNPPYFKMGSGETSENESRAMARHEVNLTLEDIISEASRSLKLGGKLYMVHIKSREKEIIKLASKYKFKVLDMVTLSGKLERILVELIAI